MRKFLLLLAVIVMGGASAYSNEHEKNNIVMENGTSTINASADELAGIRKALDAYIEAALKGDSNLARPAFAETATISYNENGKLVSGPIQALYDYYDQTGPHHAEYVITAAQVAENVAIVSIDSVFGDVRFDDMFTLVKDGSDWKIVSKIYHVR